MIFTEMYSLFFFMLHYFVAVPFKSQWFMHCGEIMSGLCETQIKQFQNLSINGRYKTAVILVVGVSRRLMM